MSLRPQVGVSRVGDGRRQDGEWEGHSRARASGGGDPGAKDACALSVVTPGLHANAGLAVDQLLPHHLLGTLWPWHLDPT